MDYLQFLETKHYSTIQGGIEINPADLHPMLMPHQREITLWALRKGQALVGLDTGLGKTFIQLEWARLIADTSLIIAPLSVARQTVREAKKIDLVVRYVRSNAEVTEPGIYITNYEMAEKFDPALFGAVVLDESSILKGLEGKTRLMLTKNFANVPYRLCCTATPAPNDETEIGMHSEYLGAMKNNEMLAAFFIHANKVEEEMIALGNGTSTKVKTKQSGNKGQEWRLRNHGKQHFYQWMASWAMMMSKPSDLGYPDDGYKLPPLKIEPIFVDVDYRPEDQLVFTGLKGIQDRTKVRRATLDERVNRAAELVNTSKEQWIVWCALQSEADALMAAIPDGVEIKGSDDPDSKAEQMEAFQDKKYRVLVTKPKIAGFGMNFQNAHNMIFVGLGDSWESYYQCIRREWRFGQKKAVNVYIVLSEVEREIYENVMAKEAMANEMKRELINSIKAHEEKELMHKIKDTHNQAAYNESEASGETWRALLGDSTERLKELAAESVDMSVYSPPFADLYTYSASERDLGNSKDWDEFFIHYGFILNEMFRLHKPGTVTAVHTADIAAMSMKDGYIGLRDFPGRVIEAHERAGFVYHGWAVVSKNPQAQAIRTKSKALLFVQLEKDSSHSRPAILDRVLFFKKPGERDNPVTPTKNGEMNNETWIDWAGGIWTGISESDTLQYTTAREPDDEKHICPLQLGTIERCIKLYSNPGELVLTPFLGIGSEAYTALKFGRRAIGCELKQSYWRIAVQNLRAIENETARVDLFSYSAEAA